MSHREIAVHIVSLAVVGLSCWLADGPPGAWGAACLVAALLLQLSAAWNQSGLLMNGAEIPLLWWLSRQPGQAGWVVLVLAVLSFSQPKNHRIEAARQLGVLALWALIGRLPGPPLVLLFLAGGCWSFGWLSQVGRAGYRFLLPWWLVLLTGAELSGRSSPYVLAPLFLLCWLQSVAAADRRQAGLIRRLDGFEQERRQALQEHAQREVVQSEQRLELARNDLQVRRLQQELVSEVTACLFQASEVPPAVQLVALILPRFFNVHSIIWLRFAGGGWQLLHSTAPSALPAAGAEKETRVSLPAFRLTQHDLSAAWVPMGEFFLYLGRSTAESFQEEELLLAHTLQSVCTLGLQSILRYQDYQRGQIEMLQASKMAAVGQFAAGVAHELNSPLAAALLQLSLLEELSEQPDLAPNLAIARDALKHAQHIIHRLLFYSREGGLGDRPIDINIVVRDTLVLLGHQLRVERVEVRLELSEQELLVRVNPNDAQQILTNLVLNARDAYPPESASRGVRIRTGRDGHTCWVGVEDQGPGVHPAIRDRIFEPFFTTKEVGRGTGLGLYVSRQLASNWGGQLDYEPAAPAGSLFVLHLPAMDAEG